MYALHLGSRLMDLSNTKLVISESFGELPESSRALLRAVHNPFMDGDWFEVFSEHVAPALGKELWLSLTSNEETLAVLPLLSAQEGRLKVLRSMSNYYSSYFDVITKSDNVDLYLSELVKCAKSVLESHDLIDLVPLTPGAKARVLQAFSANGYITHAYHHTENWRQLDIQDFESFWASRPSRLKSTVKRKGKKLEKTGYDIQVINHDLTSDQISHYNDIYLKSWKVPEPFETFVPAIMRRASAAGTLRLGMLYVEGKPAAAQLWLVESGTAYIYKLAYDPDFANLSVGSILSHHLFRHAIEIDGVQVIDYLTGNDAYKAEWMSTCRPLYGVQAASPKRIGGLLVVLKGRCGVYARQVFSRAKGMIGRFRIKKASELG